MHLHFHEHKIDDRHSTSPMKPEKDKQRYRALLASASKTAGSDNVGDVDSICDSNNTPTDYLQNCISRVFVAI